MEQNKIESVIGDYKTFLDNIFRHLKKVGFSADEFKELDHIAYRTENLDGYQKVREKIIGFSRKYSEEMFGGRLIMVCSLNCPLVYNKFKIKGFELLAPKEGNKFKEGLEHAEFVTKTLLSEFRKKHEDIGFNLKAYDREENPELIVDFKNCAVKFHTRSLLEIRNI